LQSELKDVENKISKRTLERVSVVDLKEQRKSLLEEIKEKEAEIRRLSEPNAKAVLLKQEISELSRKLLYPSN